MDSITRALTALRPLAQHLDREVALVLPGDADQEEGCELVSIGGCRSVPFAPADALCAALRRDWPSYLLVHTHLDDMPPSSADREVTKRLVAASWVVGVPLAGHFVLTPHELYDCFAA